MAPTASPRLGDAGYTLIELLVVLAIVGILAIVGVSTLGNRGGNSVRVLLDELEGGIQDAQKYAVSTGKDVALVTWGPYNATVTTPTMYMARGFTSATQGAAGIQAAALAPPATPTAEQQSIAVVFAPSRNREYMNAAVVVNPDVANLWTSAMQANSSGKQNADITTVTPFGAVGATPADAGFQAAYAAANNLFTGTAAPPNMVTISGANKRFNTSFIIQVVGATNGLAIPGGAMGLIVVLANGASVYKFYNPGVNSGDGQWRRI
jgi:prepilin-type N-terminal cleavage/methylation domain-containing protein